jgi:Na+/H+ antiporter NhaD/arsenite permease-like protein
LVAIHLFMLAGVVVFAHHPAIFMGLFLFFLGLAHAYERYQDRLLLREGLLVAFFLAGLEVLGGQQQWWLQPILSQLSEHAVFFGTTLLTAFTDNAALTYLGSLVDGLSDGFKYALVAGAVTGGGLTVIANAPNPAGLAILRPYFEDEAVKPLGLFLAALPPTLIAALLFWYL